MGESRMIIPLIIAAIIVGVDQLVKWWVVKNIAYGDTLFDNPVLSLTHIRNEGAAWSILEGKMWFFYIVTAITCGVVIYFLYKSQGLSKWLIVGLSLILGGALGNFIDRLRLNFVVDMFQLEFFNFPIFNVADVALTIGVGCVFIYIILDERINKVNEHAK